MATGVLIPRSRLRPRGRRQVPTKIGGDLRHRGPVKTEDLAPWLEQRPDVRFIVGIVASALARAESEPATPRAAGRPTKVPESLGVTHAIARAVELLGPVDLASGLLGLGRNGVPVVAHPRFPVPGLVVERGGKPPDSLATRTRLAYGLRKIKNRHAKRRKRGACPDCKLAE